MPSSFVSFPLYLPYRLFSIPISSSLPFQPLIASIVFVCHCDNCLSLFMQIRGGDSCILERGSDISCTCLKLRWIYLFLYLWFQDNQRCMIDFTLWNTFWNTSNSFLKKDLNEYHSKIEFFVYLRKQWEFIKLSY